MTQECLQRHRKVLEDLKAELTVVLEAPNVEAAPVSPDSAIGRLTRQDAMQSQQMALEIERRTKARLQQVERALRRIEEGTYGTCARCGEEISASRLNARPEAHLCVKCADVASAAAPRV